MVNKVGEKVYLGQQGSKIWGKKRDAGKAFILSKPKKIIDMTNNDYLSYKATKKSKSQKLLSCNKINPPKTSLSITSKC
jgi:hypothetical protein